MKISLNWIKDYIKIPENIELSKLAYDLTMSTVEVEGMVDLSKSFENMVVGVVEEVNPHPDADKLVICKVSIGDLGDVGDDEPREIVCGGINVKQGMKVAVARPGAMVRWHGEGELVELKKAKVRGVESYGMICSSSEIGLFDLFPFEDEATIMDISFVDSKAGTPLAEALGLDDIILEVDNKSLTNRPDLWGHYGIAREIAAIYDLPFAPPEAMNGAVTAKTPKDDFEIIIDDTIRCPRYIGVNIEGLSVKPAPFEIQSRIWRVGMRPINAIVDITNYVMLATGQPTHAFDSDVVQGNIIVRRAKKGEKLLLLSGSELSLTDEDLVIADETEAIALAGVMGGAKDSILPTTDKIILEIANFDALGVRRTTIRHEVRTESSTRFEKGIDPERCDITLATAMQLFEQCYPGQDIKITGFFDNYPKKSEIKTIEVSLKWLEARLGIKLPNQRLESILGRLGFDVSFANKGSDEIMSVVVPSWRSTGDVSIPDDIMEEVARIHGLENFEPTPITTAFEGAVNQPKVLIDRKIREYLAFKCGMNEVYTYPWVGEEYINAILPGSGEMLEMTSPPSPSERYLRSSLLPNLCKAVSDNLRYFNEFSIFESAQVMQGKDYKEEYDPRESLPLQRRHVAGAFVATADQYSKVFRHAKGVLEAMARSVHMEEITLVRGEACDKPVWADDVVWLAIKIGDKTIGCMGLLSQKAAQGCGIKNASTMLFELDIDALEPLQSRTNKFTHIPEYPISEYDVSLLFDEGVKWEDIRQCAAGKEGPDNLLREVSFVEQYKGKQVPDGKKSVTIRLLIGSLKKTLTSDEIESCAAAIVKRLGKVLGAAAR
ncbi:MAG: phenylalanine--tRNA ligase subunit beta [Oscillospiraceae bacterium]|nr:phenylalanine--tRNA ligase subunit beta [Oscillospiraceae bacterium]